ncbi:putative odorant receptor 69a [Drosophila bipectinata]|uniref:putative odorant receptor 69a n=1 Tax=Drosophila bipectinata TaxID=42026 RepID=UPI0007E80827|nr:putative odorant receptor 69a [Drosophila bipectinata]KAH8259748.1 hypothetical protein KR026_009674 [Drosophila bipectinata]KAH8329619.1 hypothetical protein KR074_005007 [Drosophila pseudoananassae]
MQFTDYLKYPDIACRWSWARRLEWPRRGHEKIPFEKLQTVCYYLGSFFMGYQNIGGVVYWCLYALKAKDATTFIIETAQVFGSLMLTCVGFSKIWCFTRRRNQMEDVMAELHELYPTTRKEHYRLQHHYDWADLIMKYANLFYFAFYIFYNGSPLVLLLWEYITDDQNLSYKTQANAWYPWKVRGSAWGYALAIWVSTMAGNLGIFLTLAILNILCVCTVQLVMHFDGLATQLLNLDARHPQAHQELKHLIRYHRQLIDISDKTNEIFDSIFLTSLICSTLAICMTSVAVLLLDLAPALKNINGLLAFLVYHFMLSYLGTQINLASEKILPAAFYNNWYEGDLPYRKMLLILMLRASKPYKWKTIKLSEVSILNYVDTLKTSYQMYACVRSMNLQV